MRENLKKFKEDVRENFKTLSDNKINGWNFYYDKDLDRFYIGQKNFDKNNFFLPVTDTGVTILTNDEAEALGAAINNFKLFAIQNPEFLPVYDIVSSPVVFRVVRYGLSRMRFSLIKILEKYLAADNFPSALPLPATR